MRALLPDDPRAVGPYRLDHRLGEGGMGQVFLGTSPGGRRVAVKVIKAEYAADPRFRARFAREVEAARKVGGFYTAQVVDADARASEPWMATAYVPGPSLRDAVASGGPFDPAAVRRLGAALAEGLAAVHACGLVHRDLKPSNVIMSPDGPRIIDFGVARATDATTLTGTGSVVGTYAYMAPEQIRADRAGPPADVFALGCVLAYAATGRAPFEGGGVAAIVHRIIAEPPRLDGLGGDLRALVAACLDKDPDRRPALGEIGRRLAAPPAPAGARRVPRRALIAAAAATTAAAAAGVPAALLLGRPDEAPAKPPPFRPTGTPSPTVFVGGPIGVNTFAFADGGRTLLGPGSKELWRWDLSTGQGTPVHMPEVLASGSWAISADGRVVAGCPGDFVAFGDPATGRTTRRIEFPDRPATIALAPDGGRIAVKHGEAVGIWDVRTGRRTGPDFGDVSGCVFSADGRLLAGGAWPNGPMWVWDAATGRTVAEIKGNAPLELAFSPDGTLLAGVTDYEQYVHVWEARTGRRVHTLQGHTENADALAFSPDGGTLASGADDGTIRLWNVRTGASIATLTIDPDDVSALAFTPDGRAMASATGGGTIRLWRFP
ncbi:serine/threonine-protein kinase [Spirillospora sp. NPDC029432]|uniref:WD40 repeat domain-containing serine/threonine protein kinase n=1 Tax=Spirillospora sp. NPDC029432 TaxID=3154599 RepID=UPI0034521B07